MIDNPLALKPFKGLTDYFAFFVGRGSYWHRERKILEAKQAMAQHTEFMDSFPEEQRRKLLERYTQLKGMNAKTQFIARLEGHVAALKAEKARSMVGKLPQDALKRIERMPAVQQEVMKEYYLKKVYGKDFEKRLEEDSADDLTDALLDG
ncbi:MAG TPA: hypothetical protein HA252_01185 [Candidatus Diapherotrites archaeon]|uniref:Uncharacterized protein n=1 Tax=Candidatus Iainarchaeum sp. TaxID=3101447 RepID=A0A7J4JHF8_9ARCH|nr:hypothetical protein [Candidatus Diapherotrites archaeon]HIH15999.1 hypothetical protein [Candidatus Diapherotrites archaeon]